MEHTQHTQYTHTHTPFDLNVIKNKMRTRL